MTKWRGPVNNACSLCDEPLETGNHLFFECRFSEVVWENLAGLIGRDYTRSWREIVDLISTYQNTTKQFTLRYIFQTIIHGEKLLNTTILIMIMERNIRNKFSSVQRMGYTRLENGLRF